MVHICGKERELAQSFFARPVSRTAPGGVHRRGALPLIQPKPRPRVSAFVSPPPRPQPRAAWAGAFPDAPPPWAPLAAPAPVGSPPHRTPQMPGLSRNGAPPPSPTPRANIKGNPPQPPLRWGSRWWFACCVDLVSLSWFECSRLVDLSLLYLAHSPHTLLVVCLLCRSSQSL